MPATRCNGDHREDQVPFDIPHYPESRCAVNSDCEGRRLFLCALSPSSFAFPPSPRPRGRAREAPSAPRRSLHRLSCPARTASGTPPPPPPTPPPPNGAGVLPPPPAAATALSSSSSRDCRRRLRRWRWVTPSTITPARGVAEAKEPKKRRACAPASSRSACARARARARSRLDGGAVLVAERDVVRHARARVGDDRRLVEDDVAQVRRERRRLLRVLVEVGDRLRVRLVGLRRRQRRARAVRRDVVLARVPARVRGGGKRVRSASLAPRAPRATLRRGAHLRFEVGDVDEVVDAALDVGDGRLVGREAPLVVDDELVRVLALAQVVHVPAPESGEDEKNTRVRGVLCVSRGRGARARARARRARKVVARAVHRQLALPGC